MADSRRKDEMKSKVEVAGADDLDCLAYLRLSPAALPLARGELSYASDREPPLRIPACTPRFVRPESVETVARPVPDGIPISNCRSHQT